MSEAIGLAELPATSHVRASVPVRPDYHGLVRSEIAPLLGPGTGTLLDLGGGVGATAIWARDIGAARRVGVIDRVTPAGGLDFALTGDLEQPETIERAARQEGPFETVLCLDVLEHLSDPWAVVARLHRALAPGGAIVASIPNVRHYSALMPLLLRGKWELCDAGILDRTHLRFFTRSSAIRLMTSSGLRLRAVRGKASGGRRVRIARTLSAGLVNPFTDLQYLIRVGNPGCGPGKEGS